MDYKLQWHVWITNYSLPVGNEDILIKIMVNRAEHSIGLIQVSFLHVKILTNQTKPNWIIKEIKN